MSSEGNTSLANKKCHNFYEIRRLLLYITLMINLTMKDTTSPLLEEDILLAFWALDILIMCIRCKP